MFEFHISREARDLYKFDESLFSTTGNVILADFFAARRFADRMNRVRGTALHPERSVSASDIYALGLIDEILHFMIEQYRRSVKPTVMSEAYTWVSSKVEGTDFTLEEFTRLFPPIAVYKGLITTNDYMKGETEGTPNRYISLEEMLMLFLANENPAFGPYLELFDDTPLELRTRYPDVLRNLEEFFRSQPVFGPYGQTLIDLLRAPMKASPDSLYGQLEYIRTHWGHLLKDLLIRMLGGLDFLREEHRPRFLGPGPAVAPKFGPKEYAELERFSADLDWMPHLVLIAKSTFVWLYQLSQKYGRHIERLDQIPDEELEQLARWGFTGLWLIGIWGRSPASKKIKQLTGNPEAASSAYSIYDYVIAWELGGYEAFENLKYRASRFGIRMATDMVPNHMGIYSRWVIEHPDWFIQLPYPPFPGYRFTGPNLSDDDRVELYIEDGYWDRRDAAVVFKRVDRATGDTRYIYHGNDGTHMPWNDTAQLDHLKHEVRQAVIDLTLHVAEKFPIIRFDAAMTLAKKHFQRLWYPVPGFGGDIPSRAGQGVSTEEFNRLFPIEFWRELVDRVAVEAPNTLLLAEAFWLMEGYFVRSLGMHRVYNSAFMNMLKAEENSKYRDVIKNVLRFNPEILRRFVNFMNNPDEEPAVDQFGKGDKYFGVATMMVTMPGLPMFGHGQVEGFSEKYGMEYRKAYWNETVDEDLVRRHEHEIFPLMRKRHLFSGVEHFVFYDCVTNEGWVNEDVFAYSNRSGHERALVIYNNRYAEAQGRIHNSVGMSVETGGRRRIRHATLGESLGFKDQDAVFYLFKDQKSGLEYIRAGRDLCRNGLFIHLGAFKSNVFLDFREVYDDAEGHYQRLNAYLAGGGVPDINSAFLELYLEKLLGPLRRIIDPETHQHLLKGSHEQRAGFLREIRDPVRRMITEAKKLANGTGDVERIAARIEALLASLPDLESLAGSSGNVPPLTRIAADQDLRPFGILVIWAAVHRLGEVVTSKEYGLHSRIWMDEWLLNKVIGETLRALGYDEGEVRYNQLLLKVLTEYQGYGAEVRKTTVMSRLAAMIKNEDVRHYLGFNVFEGTTWFNREGFTSLIEWLGVISVFKTLADYPDDMSRVKDMLRRCQETGRNLVEMAAASGYKVERFTQLLGA